MTSSSPVTPLRVVTPGCVEIKCPCGGRPLADVNVMSLTAKSETACGCGRSYAVRSSLAGVTAREIERSVTVSEPRRSTSGSDDLRESDAEPGRHNARLADGQPSTPDEWDEWVKLFASRDEIADAYAGLLCTEPTGTLWREVNEAILRRWSPAGLRYIKEAAWKLARR